VCVVVVPFGAWVKVKQVLVVRTYRPQKGTKSSKKSLRYAGSSALHGTELCMSVSIGSS
jgi:hypothetical protein